MFDNRFSALLADRDAGTRHRYAAFLRQSAVELEEAADGREALVRALARAHHVVVTETRLPGINGYELCRLLRSDDATRETPIIVVTDEMSAASHDRARKAGADTILLKPCLPEVLLSEMHRMLRRSGELRSRSQELRARLAIQLSHSQALQARIRATPKPVLSHVYDRQQTTTPADKPTPLHCPACDRRLIYQRSHIGGVSENHPEQWDYYQCESGCGIFQYRHRTRKLRRVS